MMEMMAEQQLHNKQNEINGSRMANTFYALPDVNFVSNPYDYIFKFFNDAKYCLTTLQGIYAFINE